MQPLSLCQARLVGKVSKPSLELSSKNSSASVPAAARAYSWLSAKRKREDEEKEEKKKKKEEDSEERSSQKQRPCPLFKKPKICFSHPTSNASSQASYSQSSVARTESAPSKPKPSLVFHDLSQPARTLITLHKFLLRALSIHYAHNGPHAPAELGRLLDTITKLWKQRSVTQADIQKMLAIYEMSTNAQEQRAGEIAHSRSPFRLLKAGPCIIIEYAGKRKDMDGPMGCLFDNKEVHDSYRADVYALDSAWLQERHDHLSFLECDSLDNFPKLAYDIGTQTAARKSHISQQRADILKLSNAAQLRNTASISSAEPCSEVLSNAIAAVESRKQDLLDRIKAKQIASKSKAKPTPHQVLRKHALGRIDEVTEILRMMQRQQKGESSPKAYDNKPWIIKSGNGAGKVSFSLTQLRNNIRSSARVPISDEEVSMCLKMLSEELDGTWVKRVPAGSASGPVFVVVEGEGMSGRETQSRLMAKEP